MLSCANPYLVVPGVQFLCWCYSQRRTPLINFSWLSCCLSTLKKMTLSRSWNILEERGFMNWLVTMMASYYNTILLLSELFWATHSYTTVCKGRRHDYVTDYIHCDKACIQRLTYVTHYFCPCVCLCCLCWIDHSNSGHPLNGNVLETAVKRVWFNQSDDVLM